MRLEPKMRKQRFLVFFRATIFAGQGTRFLAHRMGAAPLFSLAKHAPRRLEGVNLPKICERSGSSRTDGLKMGPVPEIQATGLGDWRRGASSY